MGIASYQFGRDRVRLLQEAPSVCWAMTSAILVDPAAASLKCWAAN